MKDRTRYATLAVGSALALLFAQQANAADLATATPAPEVQAFSEKSPWQVRVRALHVMPHDSGFVSGLAGSGLSYSDTTVPELDITYFFTDNLAAELILGTTYSRVSGEGSIAGLGEIGKTWLLPPTLTMQYHFTDFGAFKPYVGAGVNYTMFYNQSGKAAQSLDVKNTFGAALQVGVDYMIDDHWGVNFDVKKLFLRPDFSADLGGGTVVNGKAKLDPWLIGAGVTYRF